MSAANCWQRLSCDYIAGTNRHDDSFDLGASQLDTFDPTLLGSLGEVLKTVLSEVRSCHEKFDAMNGRLDRIEASLAQMKEGQILDIGANQHWKTQVANEMKKISQQQDIGECM